MLTPPMRKLVVIFLILEEILFRTVILCIILYRLVNQNTRRVRRRVQHVQPYLMLERIPGQHMHLNRLHSLSEADCIANLRMSRNSFAHLCVLMRELGGLLDQRYVSVEEQVATFLCILGHHKKNRVVSFDFRRSGQTISSYLHQVLKAVLKLHNIFLVTPTPVSNDSTNPRWKWFKGCLGALDGTYIDVHVPSSDIPRFRTRKGGISTNVLGVCDHDMRFVYVLPGWEGSAADCRVLRDAVLRPYGLKVPRGTYYLCDNGYANSEGFLSPYRGFRYHLKEWGPTSQRPVNHQEHFNMRHTRARNIIERAFGVVKMRFGILRSASYYPIKTQVRLILACFLLHNYIRSMMPVDPVEHEFDQMQNTDNLLFGENVELIDGVESSPAWHNWRTQLSVSMFQEYQSRL